MQKLNDFVMPHNFRGKNPLICQLWWIVQSCFFSTSPQFMYKWRVFLLRLFGAKIGQNVIIRPTARITFPWKLSVGDNSWIGDHVEVYNLERITIHSNSVISQRSYLCTGSHDPASRTFRIYAEPIVIEEGAWIATDVFIAPGVTVGRNALVGARSSLFTDAKADYVYVGYPAKPIKMRKFEN
ncbi:putative colanic acid biosynthesis acetyltransferase [Pseudomonas fragi]|uniref:putative colanic acid biosynthesis acetyltransferase n=1 Tax=Pseudomonas fragi TaxID=296 RepID=UPI001F44A525|nr:putative colanic acid biosynthesis acetyltransferase [Pseudomonas fragi]